MSSSLHGIPRDRRHHVLAAVSLRDRLDASHGLTPQPSSQEPRLSSTNTPPTTLVASSRSPWPIVLTD